MLAADEVGPRIFHRARVRGPGGNFRERRPVGARRIRITLFLRGGRCSTTPALSFFGSPRFLVGAASAGDIRPAAVQVRGMRMTSDRLKFRAAEWVYSTD